MKLTSSKLLLTFSLVAIVYIKADENDVPDNTIYLTVESNDKPILLSPSTGPGLNERRWFIRACKECKLMIGCVFTTKDCKNAAIKIFTGVEFIHFCPDLDRGLKQPSYGNYMQVTMENRGEKPIVACQVRTSKPYIGVPNENIDSSEHGQSRTAKKAKQCKCGWTNKSGQRIVGGKETGINEYPFIVNVKVKKQPVGHCGGSIITDYHVLTAAHCTYPLQKHHMVVVVGEHDVMLTNETTATKEIDVDKMIIHEQYVPKNDLNDISLLVLKEQIKISVRVGPVCLPSIQKNYLGQYVKVLGWGLTKGQKYSIRSPVLLKANLRVIDPDVCKMFFNTLPDRQMCTFNDHQDSCRGDSGGPVISPDPETNMFYQIGIISFGRECAATDPAVNTDVAYYINWIRQHVTATQPKAILCN